LYRTRRALAIPVFLLFLVITKTSDAQVASPADPKPADYSKEPYVFEQLIYKTVLQGDGTYSLDVTARVRVQSQAGVQQLGILNFPYASAMETEDVVYVRVLKPDQRVIVTPAENVLDMPTEITQQAPFYSDQKQKQVAVKGLEIGDVVEYQSHNVAKTALDPGQFWFAFNFFRAGICLHEELQVSVPRDRYVKVESPKLQPTTADQGAYRVYTWKSANLQTEAEKKAAQAAANTPESDEPERPAVQITSFRNWDELGQWMGGLVASRAVVTPQIKAKADEITRNAKTDQEKIQALYDYVSTKFRYIGIALGIGRYQPHAADDVLSNDYGDCKDKHTLFAALLAAENIKAYPALISSGLKLDPDLPSPQQFDHVITAIPQSNGYLFLDTTAEVAPFGYLIAELRDKDALVVPGNGPAKLVRTPKEPPFKPKFDFKTDGKLDDAGTLVTKSQINLRSDIEVAYREAFRRAGEPQWVQIMQQISGLLGFGGTVSDVTISPPDATTAPFQVDYTYTRKTYGDWDNRQIVSPFPFVYLPDVPEEPAKKLKPIKLGPPTQYVFHGTMTLPPKSDPAIRGALDLREEFADYHSTYAEKNGVLTFDRTVITKTDEIAPAQFDAYSRFVKKVGDDQGKYIPLHGDGSSSSDGFIDPAAREAFSQGAQAFRDGIPRDALAAFKRATEKDPQYAEAWYWLGQCQLNLSQTNAGLDSIRKAIAIDPQKLYYYKALAALLKGLHRDQEAIDVLKQLNKISPGDPDGAQALAVELERKDKYSEAIAVLEPALKQNPEDPKLQLALGEAYLHAGNKEQAMPLLKSATDSPVTKNTATADLADNGVDLQPALELALKGVADAEAESMAIKLDDLQFTDPQAVTRLADAWNLLGVLKFQTGQLDDAERLLNAAWNLTQNPATADRLGQVYEKLGKNHEAALAYARAIASGSAPPETRGRLIALRAQSKAQPSEAADQISLQEFRTIKLTKFPAKPAKHASAEFFILFGSAPKATSVQFISGSEELRDVGPALAASKIEAVFPDANPTQILRRGILDCEPEIVGCVLVLFEPRFVSALK
jgi:tetratricopeptide (TPR) repeat protein